MSNKNNNESGLTYLDSHLNDDQQDYLGSGPLNQQQGYPGSGPLNQQQSYPGSGPLYQQQGYPGNGPLYQQQFSSFPTPSNNINSLPKKNKSGLLIFLIIQAIVILILYIYSFIVIGSDDDSTKKSNKQNKQKLTTATTEAKSDMKELSEALDDSDTDLTTESIAEASNDTYENNQYYDIIDTATYNNSIGDTIVIHKIKAKQNVSVSSTAIAYSEDGSVIGKSSSDVELTEGQNNYFQYYFDGEVDVTNIQATAKASDPSWMNGERNAVEMENYNVSDNNLYITFKQTSNELGSFAKFKILFYSGEQIIGAEDGYFSTYAENLIGKDTTDVAEIWVYGKDFDNIEYIFEP